MTQKILINWREGASQPEEATITLILAVTSSKTCETAPELRQGGTSHE